jgi:hypothetical protein
MVLKYWFVQSLFKYKPCTSFHLIFFRKIIYPQRHNLNIETDIGLSENNYIKNIR